MPSRLDVFSSLAIWAGDREASQLTELREGDIVLGSETWQLPLASPMWTPQSRDISAERGFL